MTKRRTSRSMLGRSKPRTIWRTFLRPRAAMISSRTAGAAVAVSATTGGCPSRSMTWPSLR
ncbi:hypothetical protein [Streptosporangium vulgare]|uniref:hypothetical protein n=1 Tax=Streptosporangium vulgare TaxID=46190 RepID=UPI0031DB27F7